MILTAKTGTNADLFPDAVSLYVAPGSRVLDMTWGKGVFWKNVDQSCYDLVRNDLDPARGDVHEDFRFMSFPDSVFDAIVFDPPYSSRSSNKRSFIGSLYNNGHHKLNTVEDMIKFYLDGMTEAYRLLKKNGILFVKCMDEVAGGRQRRNHITIWRDALSLGFIDEDLFVLQSKGKPVMRHPYQNHARKNNSFLWTFRKNVSKNSR